MTEVRAPTKPAPVDEDPWITKIDPLTGYNYYYNTRTHASSWSDPHQPAPKPPSEAYPTRERGMSARSMFQSMGKKFSSKKGSDWVELYDESSGYNYYRNDKTGVVQWGKPISFRSKKDLLR